MNFTTAPIDSYHGTDEDLQGFVQVDKLADGTFTVSFDDAEVALKAVEKAKAIAEKITMDELKALLAIQPMPTLLVRNRSRAHATGNVRLYADLRRPFIGYSHGNRRGFDTSSTATVENTIFDFYNLGRIVQVAS